MKIIINGNSGQTTHDNAVSASFILGFESIGGTWTGSIEMNTQSIFDCMSYAYFNDYDMVVRSYVGMEDNISLAKTYYPKTLLVMPAGTNSNTLIYNGDIPTYILVTGAGSSSNQTGYKLEFFADDSWNPPSEESSYSNGYIAGQIAYIMGQRQTTSSYEARYCAQQTGTQSGSFSTTDGYGQINVSASIAYTGSIPVDQLELNVALYTLSDYGGDAYTHLTPVKFDGGIAGYTSVSGNLNIAGSLYVTASNSGYSAVIIRTPNSIIINSDDYVLIGANDFYDNHGLVIYKNGSQTIFANNYDPDDIEFLPFLGFDTSNIKLYLNTIPSTDNNIYLGGSSNRFKNIYLSELNQNNIPYLSASKFTDSNVSINNATVNITGSLNMTGSIYANKGLIVYPDSDDITKSLIKFYSGSSGVAWSLVQHDNNGYMFSLYYEPEDTYPISFDGDSFATYTSYSLYPTANNLTLGNNTWPWTKIYLNNLNENYIPFQSQSYLQNSNINVDNKNITIINSSSLGYLAINASGDANQYATFNLRVLNSSSYWYYQHKKNPLHSLYIGYTDDDVNYYTSFIIEPKTPTNTLYLQSGSGNVGIMIAKPTAKLHVSGSIYYRNKVRRFVAGENLSYGHLCCLRSDSKFWKAYASNSVSASGLLGIASESITANNSGTFILDGEFVTSSLTGGSKYYINSQSSANMTATQITGSNYISRITGYALNSTIFYFKPDNSYIILG